MSAFRPIKFAVRLAAAVAVMVALALVAVPAASADCSSYGPATDQYCPPPPPPPTSEVSSGGLPFTGFDVGLAVLVAAGLVAAGYGLRRVAQAE